MDVTESEFPSTVPSEVPFEIGMEVGADKATQIQHVTIRPNPDLLYPNFDKYILSTDRTPIIKTNLNPMGSRF